jgi:hypothetical protein
MGLVLPMPSWDTINVLSFNRKVLMIGVDGPDEVISLAQTAHMLLVVPDSGSGEAETQWAICRNIDDHLHGARLDRRVIVWDAAWRQAVHDMRYTRFDLAVLTPGAIAGATPGEIITAGMAAAETVVVIQPPGCDLWESATDAARGRGKQCTSDGSIIVAAPRGAEPAVSVARWRP